MEFFKVHATGNDFILIDDRTLHFPQNGPFISQLCRRHTGIGADGLILLQPSSVADIKMRFFNPDGNCVPFCGNGVRATAYIYRELGFDRPTLEVESGCGLHTIAFDGELIRATLPEPTGMRLNLMTDVGGRELNLHFVNTGVPHVVCFVSQIDADYLIDWAKEIRSHLRFGKEGVNCNFVRIGGDGTLLARTYERGVEGETLSCGSGGAAIFWVARALFSLQGRRTVRFSSGEEIIYDYESELAMSGRVTPVFKGYLTVPESKYLVGQAEVLRSKILC